VLFKSVLHWNFLSKKKLTMQPPGNVIGFVVLLAMSKLFSSEDGLPPSMSEAAPLPTFLVPEAANIMAHALVDSPAWVELIRGNSSTRIPALAWIFEVYICAVRSKDPTAVHCIVSRPADTRPGENQDWPSLRNGGSRSPDTAEVATLAEHRPVVLAAAILIAPATRPTLFELLCAGMALFPLRFGIAATFRLWRLMDWFERAQEDIWGDGESRSGGDEEKNHRANGSLPSQPLSGPFSRAHAISLERMVVRPDCQGRGLGSALLRGTLAEMRRDGQTVVLTTQDKRNVKFYSRLGFRVRSEREYNPSDSHVGGAQYAFHCWFMDTSPI
jgi:ribosomal protein S18 acetylase RimI-like enzyme